MAMATVTIVPTIPTIDPVSMRLTAPQRIVTSHGGKGKKAAGFLAGIWPVDDSWFEVGFGAEPTPTRIGSNLNACRTFCRERFSVQLRCNSRGDCTVRFLRNRHQTRHLVSLHRLVRRQTLYPTELRAHPWLLS